MTIDGPVLVVGAGLIGTSIALSLRRSGVDVLLTDVDHENLRIAFEAGAGRALDDGVEASIVVVAVPPRHAAAAIARASDDQPRATITDVTSVKEGVIREALALGADPVRLVGGHPMAGREVSGSAGARKELLDDRMWVVTPLPTSGADHVARVRALIETCGAVPVDMGLAEHDDAVALVSHAPHVLSALLAGRLVDSRPEYVRIAGQGLRDMTRIAASNVDMWTAVLAANAGPIADILADVQVDLDRTISALRRISEGGATPQDDALVEQMLRAGVFGQRLIPGKHGEAASTFGEVNVLLADRPGELGRLFSAVGVAQVNLEDMRIEHVYGRPSGLVALHVRPEAVDRLVDTLQGLGFDVRS